MTNEKLIKKASRKTQLLKILRKDPRYLKTIGKLKHEGLLDTHEVAEYRGQVFLDEALWAAELEPRIYELLPAVIARRPGLFVFFKLPEDLQAVVREVKRGRVKTPYHGIPAEKYNRWVKFVARNSRASKVTKNFRFSPEDLKILNDLSEKMSQTQTQIISLALRDYASRKAN